MSRETFINDWLPLRNGLYRVACRLLGSAAEAEDAVQDLYLKLWQTSGSFDGVRNPKAYCLTLLRNSCLDRLKSKRMSGRSSMDGVEPEQPPEDGQIAARQKMQAVLEAVESLPERERTVLKMRIIDDLSYEQIQKRTGIPYLSLRVLLSGARKKLKKIADEYEKD